MEGSRTGAAEAMTSLHAMQSARSSAGAMGLIIVGLIVAWWGWKSGAFFEVTFLPGTIVLLGLLGWLLFFAPWSGSLRSPVGVTIVALLCLAAWTLLTVTWSPAPAEGVADVQRTLGYATAFALGAWTCLLLGKRAQLSLLPIAVGGAIVGVATLIALWTGTNSHDFFERDGTLRYPIGYRNAEAAFFLMAALPMLVLAARAENDWRFRGALVGVATIAIELMILAQSRASLFAAVVGVTVLIAVHPSRLRILAWLGLAIVPAAIALPWLLDVYQQNAGNTAGSIPPLHAACRAIAITAAFAIAGGCAAARLDPRIRLAPGMRKSIGGGLLACAAALIIAGFIAIAASAGGITGFISGHVGALSTRSPDLESSGTRFGLDFRTERGDTWRVARDDFANHPLDGEGSGGFRASYLLHRREPIEPEDPHSVEMLMASELGIPGVLLFAAAAIAAVVAAFRSRRLGPQPAALAGAALGVGAYWFVHASVDWFWPYPGVTLPMVFTLGAAGAPAIRRQTSSSRTPLRIGLGVAAGLIAIALLPFFFSARYTNAALRSWRSDLSGAYRALGDAADLNPLSARPLAAEAYIAESSGDRARALRALSEAEDREPKNWLFYYMQARTLAQADPASARLALARARAHNPRGEEIAALTKKLGPPASPP